MNSAFSRYELFRTEPKNRHITNQNSNARISSMWCPYGVFEGQFGCPYGCSNGSRATHEERSDELSFFCCDKNRHITNQNSNDRISIKGRFTPLYHRTLQLSQSPLRTLDSTAPYDHFSIVSARFARRPKIDMFCCKLRTIVSRIKGFYHSTPQPSRSPNSPS